MIKHIRILLFPFLLSIQLFGQQTDTADSKLQDVMEVAPTVTKRVEPEFPALAENASLEAEIRVKVAIDEKGVPYKTAISKRDPEFVYIFDDEVRKSAMQWRFSPALNKKGEPIKVWVVIPFHFRMRNYDQPVLIERAAPEYPKEALEMGMEGWVGVGVLVNKNGGTMGDGKVVIVSREFPYTKIFDDAAIDAVRRSKFKPATDRGTVVLGWLFYKIEFKLP